MPEVPDWFQQGLATEIAGWIITGLAAWAMHSGIRLASQKTKIGIPIKLSVVGSFSLIGLCIASLTGYWSLVFVVFIASVFLVWFSLRGLFRIGLFDAFETTDRGITYSTSLKLSHESISFLGIGAHKLTSDDDFEDAIRRCSHGGGTARFLLSAPTNNLLSKLALQNGFPADGYQQKVRESLKLLAHLKISKSLNIEVRFHPTEHRKDFQQFRLMIINQNICLLSWTVWDERIGRGNPQILLKQTVAAKRQKSTLFKAFSDYFEEMWASGTPANLKDYL